MYFCCIIINKMYKKKDILNTLIIMHDCRKVQDTKRNEEIDNKT